MILIYDFDGTLTPCYLPQYDILINNGYDDQKIMKLVHNIMNSEKKLYIRHTLLHIKTY